MATIDDMNPIGLPLDGDEYTFFRKGGTDKKVTVDNLFEDRLGEFVPDIINEETPKLTNLTFATVADAAVGSTQGGVDLASSLPLLIDQHGKISFSTQSFANKRSGDGGLIGGWNNAYYNTLAQERTDRGDPAWVPDASNRGSFYAFGGVIYVGVLADTDGDVAKFGVEYSSALDQSSDFQACLDAGLNPYYEGVVRTEQPLYIRKAGQKITAKRMSQTECNIDCYATNAAGDVGDVAAIKFEGEANNLVISAGLENVYINVRNTKVVGIDITELSYGDIGVHFCRLYASEQVGLFGKGNGLGTAPYYNGIEGVSVFGQNNPITHPGQLGILFARATTGALVADGPNGNNISNIKRIAGVQRAIDMQSGNGNTVSGAQIEAVADYGIAFNDHGGTETKAQGNVVSNLRQEGSTAAQMVRFFEGADNNVVSQFYQTSVGPTKWSNDSDSSNIVNPKGVMMQFSFYASDIPASSTIFLDPTATGGEGGVQMPMNMAVHAIGVGVNRFSSGGLGSGVVQILRNGVARTDMDITVDDANRFGSSLPAPNFNPASTSHLFDTNSRLQCKIITDATWNQTTADVHVTVIMIAT